MEESRTLLCDWCEEPVYEEEKVHIVTIRGDEYLVHGICGQAVLEAHTTRGGGVHIEKDAIMPLAC